MSVVLRYRRNSFNAKIEQVIFSNFEMIFSCDRISNSRRGVVKGSNVFEQFSTTMYRISMDCWRTRQGLVSS